MVASSFSRYCFVNVIFLNRVLRAKIIKTDATADRLGGDRHSQTGDLNVYTNALGSILPLQAVTVKSHLDGQIMKIHFQKGQTVNAGFLLAEIDPGPYDAQLKKANGQLLRDQALLENARLDLKRYKVLTEQDSIARAAARHPEGPGAGV